MQSGQYCPCREELLLSPFFNVTKTIMWECDPLKMEILCVLCIHIYIYIYTRMCIYIVFIYVYSIIYIETSSMYTSIYTGLFLYYIHNMYITIEVNSAILKFGRCAILLRMALESPWSSLSKLKKTLVLDVLTGQEQASMKKLVG